MVLTAGAGPAFAVTGCGCGEFVGPHPCPCKEHPFFLQCLRGTNLPMHLSNAMSYKINFIQTTKIR